MLTDQLTLFQPREVNLCHPQYVLPPPPGIFGSSYGPALLMLARLAPTPPRQKRTKKRGQVTNKHEAFSSFDAACLRDIL